MTRRTRSCRKLQLALGVCGVDDQNTIHVQYIVQTILMPFLQQEDYVLLQSDNARPH